jgi:peptidoglycan/xylan/chitin deacetylase (PgdA/CDA1 family)
MIRTFAKDAVCRALAWARLDAWIERRTPIVLGYHRVVERHGTFRGMPGLAIDVAMLERHLDWIGSRCRFVDLDELGAILERGDRSGPVCAVTFDDGYADVHDHAFPLLREKGIPGAVFVVSQAADGATPLLHDRIYRAIDALQRAGRRLPPPARAIVEGSHARFDPHRAARAVLEATPHQRLATVAEVLEAHAGTAPRSGDDDATLDWDAVLAMHRGGMTIGSHTRTHARLVGQDRTALVAEIAGSRTDLARRLGDEVSHFAYPDGQFDPAVVSAVEDAGYRHAYTICRHRDPRRPHLTIPRTMLWQRSSLDAGGRFSGAVLGCQTHGAVPFLDPCHREHGWAS